MDGDGARQLPQSRHPARPAFLRFVVGVVLSYFDDLKLKHTDFRYFRYGDDIRLFAKDEHTLRRLLVRLDEMSRTSAFSRGAAKSASTELRISTMS